MDYPYRFAPSAEVMGAVMSAVFNHYQRSDVLESLQKHGLDYFEADQWYPVDTFVNLLAEWWHIPEFFTTFVSVGIAMAYHIELPDEAEALGVPEKLMLMGDLHMQQHRGQGVGGYQVKRLSANSIRYTENTLWPDDMIYGYLYGAAQRYLDKSMRFTLQIVNNTTRQDMGGSETILDLSWEPV